MSQRKPSIRLEHDLLGEREVPDGAYYGVQTLRGMENFRISGVPLAHYPELIQALAMVKMAAARANRHCSQLSQEITAAIEAACGERISGRLHDQFRLDVFQGGAGTSTNMRYAAQAPRNHHRNANPVSPDSRRSDTGYPGFRALLVGAEKPVSRLRRFATTFAFCRPVPERGCMRSISQLCSQGHRSCQAR